MAVALDVLALFVAFFAVWFLRGGLGEFLASVSGSLGYDVKEIVRRPSETYRILLSPNPLVNIQNYLWVLYLSIPAWLFFLNTQRGYDAQAQRNGRQEFAICAYAGLLGSVALMVFMVLFKLDVSRLLLVGFLTTGVLFLWLERTLLLPIAQRRTRQPMRNLLVIGNRDAAARFAGILKTPAYSRSRLIGYISDETTADGTHQSISTQSNLSEVTELRHIGKLSDLASILEREVVDEVVLIRSQNDVMAGQNVDGTTAWGDILELCLQLGRTVSLVDEMVPPVGAKVQAQMMGSMPTLVLHNTPQNTLALAVKNAMDRTVALIAILVLTFIIPVLPVIALLIKLEDGGPILFKQKRVGLNGRLFTFYKFRSMMMNAAEVLEKMKREEPERYRAINIMEEPFFKAKDGDDPRITRIGRFIRKTSLDELPQFYNVLRGDMSLVGPRPPLPKEVAELEPWQRRKLSVKGGLTCLWQASGRNEITNVDEWMRLDLEYIDNWSLWLDVKLLFKTLKVLVTSKGAS